MRIPVRVLFVAATIASLLSACGSAAPPAGSTSPASPAAAADPSPQPSSSGSAAAPASGTPVPVIAGLTVTVGLQEIAVRCTGADTGRPTIVLMHGNGGGGEGQFDRVMAHLLTLSRVCVYDRPGTGNSPLPATLPRPITEVVTEAHAVLTAAKIDAPVFLLGSSEGGAIAFMYAQAYPTEVVGFVSINPNPPYAAWIAEVKKVETAEEVATLEEPDYRGENQEQIDNRPNSSMLTDPLPGSMPYALMFDEDCGGDAAFCAKVYEPLKTLDEKLTTVGALGRFVSLPGAGHQIEWSSPEEVNKVVDEVWAAAIG
jgi:pimeloyl-ACP methyl ester carboxylesterase